MRMPSTAIPPTVPADFLSSRHLTAASREPDPVVREYWTRGYIRLAGLFTPAEIAAWSAECDRLLRSDIVFPENVRTPFRMNSGDCPERIDPVVDISPVFAALASDPRITTVIEAIFHDKALLFKDKLIFKAPGTKGYTPHQDQAWWQLCPGRRYSFGLPPD